MVYTLGLNAYHGDSSACLYKDNILLSATEEERIRRVKHWAGLPTEAIKFCLEDAGIGLEDVDFIAVSRDPRAKIGEKVWQTIKKGIKIKAILDRGTNSLKITKLKEDVCNALGIKETKVKAKIIYVEHHRAHLASSFFVSPFDEAAVLSIDGMGDFSSTMWGTAKGHNIEVLNSVSYPHSIGIFYTAFTQYFGFPHYGDEYKVMGLSPYGEAKHTDKVWDVIHLDDENGFRLNEKYFRHFKEGVAMDWESGAPHVESIYSNAFIDAFGPVRQKGEELTSYHMDLAASVQRVTESVIFHLAETLHKKTGLKNLCLAGGVAQNSVANGKLLANTGFENLFVPPAGHDAGTASGAALFHIHANNKVDKAPFKHQAYTGAHFSNEEIKEYLSEHNIPHRYTESVEELTDQVSDALVDGKVIGWFQGRAEFGPRALGNRSILVDPRRDDAKALLNAKIKKRESFRPFAPSILKEYVEEYFETTDSVPFMEKVYPIKPEKRTSIPAVTHVDGSGRLQTVEEQDNPRYHALISSFYKKSGVPILLNTSFNENEPIVNTPKHAFDCFDRTSMDMLVLGNYILER
jgi:carbamoyltransferase